MLLCSVFVACDSGESTVEPAGTEKSALTLSSLRPVSDPELDPRVYREQEDGPPSEELDDDDETRADELDAPDAVDADSFLVDFVDTPLSDVVLYMTELTGENIVYSGDLTGRVTFHGARPVTREQAFEVFAIALEANGYALEHRDDFYVVVPAR